MATTDKAEFVLYDTNLTTRLAILPVVSGHIYSEINEPGSGEVRIPLDTISAGLISSGQLIVASYRGSIRFSFFVENIKEIQADANEHGGRFMSISGRGALSLLDRDVVLGDGTAASTRTFTAKTKAYVLKTIIDEVQTAGGLASLTYDFTAADDSEPVPWTDSNDYTLTVGSTILDVMRQFTATGTEFSIVYSAGGFVLSAYQGEIGTDKSSTVFFRTGINCVEVSSDERGGDIANVITVGYQNGEVTAESATSISTYGRRAKFFDARIAQSLSSATTYATAKLAIYKDPKKSIGVRIYDGIKPNLFLDYILGDYVTLDVLGTETSYRILGLQCDFDGADYSNVVVELNNIMRDVDLEREERLEWLTQQWQTAHDDKKLETSMWGKLTLNCDGQIFSLLLDGTELYIGGNFETIGPLSSCWGLASVNVTTGNWTNINVALDGDGGYVYAIKKDATGHIYFGGLFDTIAGVSANSIAKLTTSTGIYTALGTGLQTSFNPPADPSGAATCLAIDIDSNDIVWAGGEFDDAGGTNTMALAYWDGSWHADPDALIKLGYHNRHVYALIIDSNNNVYAGGNFVKASNAKANYIAMLNDSTGDWEELDTGLNGHVHALAVNSSDYVYAGGNFTDAGGVAAADRITVWNGSVWQALGTGFSAGTVVALHFDVFGTLYVGGDGLSTVNGIDINNLGRWSGSNWLAVGTAPDTGTDGDVTAIETTSTGDIYIGGYFYRAGNIEADIAGNGLHNAVYMTTFQSVMDYVGSGAGNSHSPVTIGTGNGLSINDNQVLSLALSSTSTTGALSDTDWDTFNNKLGSADASIITYTPAVAADWDGSADPGNTDDALDQLAERVKDVEGGGAVVPATTAENDFMVGDATPGNWVTKTLAQAKTILGIPYVHPNHSGDVTSVGDGATTIAVKAVTLAKMDDMATASLIYRKTAGAGAPEVNTLATLKTDLAINAVVTGTKLDDLTTPDDNTDLNANTTNHGLLLKATAPAAGLYSYVGITNAETAYTNKALFDATVPTTIAPSDSATAGTAAVAARRDHLHAAPATFPATAHNIFSTTHGDIAGAASPVDGDIIIGNVTPKWSKLAISIPAANLINVLGIVNGELRPSWKALLDATNPANIGTAAPGTATTAAHRDHVHAIPANGITLAMLATQAAQTILANATSGAAVPTALTLAEQTVLGRITGGNVIGLTAAQIRTLINVADGANAYVHPNHSGDVTSVADGATTIGAKKVTIAMLADGTDGQLITWDADGHAAVVAAGTAGQVLTSNGAGAAPEMKAAGGVYPPGHHYGCVLSNAADTTNDITISAGNWIDSTNTVNIVLASAITKQLDAAWAVGTNAGMRASGAAIANTTYHIFLILRPDTGVVDIAADTSVTGANITANTDAAYTKWRRIGSILRVGGTILQFSQLGKEFNLTTYVADWSDVVPANTNAVSIAQTVPLGIQVIHKCWIRFFWVSGGLISCLFSSLDETDQAAGGGVGFTVSSTMSTWGGQVATRTDTSAQIRRRANATTCQYDIRTAGWTDETLW